MKYQMLERTSALMTAAFGLIAVLAWNDAIKSLFVGPCDSEGAEAFCMFTSMGGCGLTRL